MNENNHIKKTVIRNKAISRLKNLIFKTFHVILSAVEGRLKNLFKTTTVIPSIVHTIRWNLINWKLKQLIKSINQKFSILVSFFAKLELTSLLNRFVTSSDCSAAEIVSRSEQNKKLHHLKRFHHLLASFLNDVIMSFRKSIAKATEKSIYFNYKDSSSVFVPQTAIGMTKNPLLKIQHSSFIILLGFVMLGAVEAQSQAVSINPTGAKPHSSAMLDVSDTTKGFLSPRLTTAQMNAVSSPATGLLIYNTDSLNYAYYNGSSWKYMVGTATLNGANGGKIQHIADKGTGNFNGRGSVAMVTSNVSYNGDSILQHSLRIVGLYQVSFFAARENCVVSVAFSINTDASISTDAIIYVDKIEVGGNTTTFSSNIESSANKTCLVNANFFLNTGDSIRLRKPGTSNTVDITSIKIGIIASTPGNSSLDNGVLSYSRLPIGVTDSSRIADSDNGTQVSVADESNIIFTTGAAESARINATGYLGLGNSNPSTWLDINTASAASGVRIEGDFEPGIQLDAVGAKGKQWEIFSASGATSEGQGSLVFYDRDSAVTRMSIDTLGNVSVGTKPSAPYHKLGVSTNKIGGLFRLNQENATLGSEISFFINDNFKWSLGGSEDSYTLGESFFIYNNDRTFTDFFIDGDNGYTGIGTNSPVSQLDVRAWDTDQPGIISVGNSDRSHFLELFGGQSNNQNAYLKWKQGDPLRFATDSGGFFETMRITSNGKVGIGTTNPTSTLDVNGTIRGNQVSGKTSATTGQSTIFAASNASGNGLYLKYVFDAIGNIPANTWQFRSTGTRRDIVFSGVDSQISLFLETSAAGNVGIGTTTPNKSLDVEGTFGFSGTSTLPGSVGQFDLDVSSNSHFIRDNFVIGPAAPTLRRIVGGEVGQIITITFDNASGDLNIVHDASTGTGDPIYIDGLAQDAFQLFGGYRALILVKGVNAWYLVTTN